MQYTEVAYLHVLSHVSTEDVLLQEFSAKALLFAVVAYKALFTVGDIKSTIKGALQQHKKYIV